MDARASENNCREHPYLAHNPGRIRRLSEGIYITVISGKNKQLRSKCTPACL